MKSAWFAIIGALIVLALVFVNNYKPDSSGDSSSSSTRSPSSSSSTPNTANNTSTVTRTPESLNTFKLAVGTSRTIKRAEYAIKFPSGVGTLNYLSELMIPGKTEFQTVQFTDDAVMAMLQTSTAFSFKGVSNVSLLKFGADIAAPSSVKFAFSSGGTYLYMSGNGTDRKQFPSTNSQQSLTLSVYNKKTNALADTAVAVNADGDLVIFANAAKKLDFHHTSDLTKVRGYDPQLTGVPIGLVCSPATNHLVIALANSGKGQTRLKCMSFVSKASDAGVLGKDLWTLAPQDVFQVDKVTYISGSTVVYARKSGVSQNFGEVGLIFNANTSTPVFQSFSLLETVGKQIATIQNRTATNDISTLAPSGVPDMFFIGTTDGKVYLCIIATSGNNTNLTVSLRFVDTSTADPILAINSTVSRS